MSLQVCSLNSGSNANCYYVGNAHEAVLVDAGLSCRETERRMKASGLSMEKVKAIFISHEHADHITGMSGLSKKFRLPVFVTPQTLQHSRMPLEPGLVQSFKHNKPVRIGGLSIIPFTKSHDAADPHSFMISSNAVNAGVITDIGYPCKQVINFFSKCHVAFLESNYCADMLENGDYPYHLKRRISSDQGHLSNAQALELFTEFRSPALQLLILSHLSKNNNDPKLVENLFIPHAGATKIFVASRYEASPVFSVEGPAVSMRTVPAKKPKHQTQLSLFN